MPAAIFNADSVKILKDKLKFKTGSQIITGDSDDPTSTAKSAPQGSVYLRSTTNVWYLKQDSGSTTNWSQIIDTDLTQTLNNKQVFLQGDATAPLEAATKQQLDAAIDGVQRKASVSVSTTANITLSGEQTIDGVLTSASRVLVKSQSTASENGIYVSAAGAWSRATDANSSSELNHAIVSVESGTADGNKAYEQTTNSPSIGVDNIVWVQTYGVGTYVADETSLTLSGATFSIKTDGVTTTKVLDSNITNAKIATGVDAAKLADGSVSNTELQYINSLSSNAQDQIDSKASGPATATDNAVARYDATTGKLIQDSGVIIDDTNNVSGVMRLDAEHTHLTHSPTENGEHTLGISTDAGGFGDIKAIEVNYTSGAIIDGDDTATLLINIDETLSTGGDIYGMQVLTTDVGGANIKAVKVGIGVAPIDQSVGANINPSSILVNATSKLTELSTGGAGNETVFSADNDTITIGHSTPFSSVQFLIDTGANTSVKPTWEFSTGVGTWQAMVPIDGTNGFKNTGTVSPGSADISAWAVGAGGEYLVRITRTQNGLSTLPILDVINIAVAVGYSWDKDGKVAVSSLDIESSTPVTSILDEDSMSSDSATALATQQSIKAYADTKAVIADVFNITSSSGVFTAVVNNTHLVDTSGGVATITLPAAVTDTFVRIKDKGNANTNNITVNTPAAETIDGAASDVINSDYGSIVYVCDGTNWYKL